MSRLTLSVAIICLCIGLGAALFQAIQTNWLSASSALILGPTVGLAFLLGSEASRESFLIKGLAVLAGILGFFAIFVEHRAFDVKLTEAHAAALNAFVGMQIFCPVMNYELRNIQREGVMACALQDNSDQLGAILELQKATTLGPTLSLVDSVRTAAKEPDADWCAETFRAARPLCPVAFSGMTEASQYMLLK